MRNRKVRANVNLHEALEEIRLWIGDRKPKSYTRKGCRVSMANLESKPANRVMLDVDMAYPTDTSQTNQCDFILFQIDDVKKCIIGVPMELKRGGFDASDVVKQLQSGARIADSCSPKEINITLVPVLFYGGSTHKHQLNKLKESRIRFRGGDIPINIARCGHNGNLAQALKKPTKR